MRITINGAQPFQVLATNFSIGPSNEGYTLQISADGRNFSDLFTVPANTTRMVTSVANGSTYRLNGNNSEVVVNWERQCSDGGSGGSGSGGTDPAVVQQMIAASLLDYTQDLIDGEPIVGMASQLYSPDGVDSEGIFNYRTTAGDADVNSGVAELKQVGGNSIYPEGLIYDDSASLSRGGEPVTGFSADIEWGDFGEWVDGIAESAHSKTIRFRMKGANGQYWIYYKYNDSQYSGDDFKFDYDPSTKSFTAQTSCSAISDTQIAWGDSYLSGIATFDKPNDTVEISITGGSSYDTAFFQKIQGSQNDNQQTLIVTTIPNDISAGTHSYTYSDSVSAWTPYVDTAQTDDLKPMVMRTMTNTPNGTDFLDFYVGPSNESNALLKCIYNGSSWDNELYSPQYCTAITQNEKWSWSFGGASGIIDFDGSAFTITVETEGYYISRPNWYHLGLLT